MATPRSGTACSACSRPANGPPRPSSISLWERLWGLETTHEAPGAQDPRRRPTSARGATWSRRFPSKTLRRCWPHYATAASAATLSLVSLPGLVGSGHSRLFQLADSAPGGRALKLPAECRGPGRRSDPASPALYSSTPRSIKAVKNANVRRSRSALGSRPTRRASRRYQASCLEDSVRRSLLVQ